jgi:hypothetical protein
LRLLELPTLRASIARKNAASTKKSTKFVKLALTAALPAPRNARSILVEVLFGIAAAARPVPAAATKTE